MPRGPVDLLDINVWLALADENHENHGRARHYWEQESAARLAFCRVTMLGLLRLSTHRKVMDNKPFTNEEAWRAYRNFRALPEVTLLADPPTLESSMAAWTVLHGFPNHRWTDAYLAALAQSSGARLVSFDVDFLHFSKLNVLHLKVPAATQRRPLP